MDNDDDYFTPTAASSQRLAMLFSPEEMTNSSSSSRTNYHSSSTMQFKFVAPKEPRSSHNNSLVSPLCGNQQPALGDGQEVLLEVPLIKLPQETEQNGMPRTRVSCRVLGNAACRSFSLIVATMEQPTEELWRAAIDSELALEVMEHSLVKVTLPTRVMLTLLGEEHQIETLVTQVAICRGVASYKVTQQDLHTGKGHVLAEGDVAKVSCITYNITATACRGEKVEELKGVKVTVRSPTFGSWESCLAGAAADTHRLIFIPKNNKGDWQPPTQYYDVKIVKTKSGREKGVAGVRSGNQTQEQQHTLSLQDGHPTTNSLSFTEVPVKPNDSQKCDGGEEEDKAVKKAALVTRMAQVGTQIFPLMASGRPVPQLQVKPEIDERLRGVSAEDGSLSAPTPSTITPTFPVANPTPTATLVCTSAPPPVPISTTINVPTPLSNFSVPQIAVTSVASIPVNSPHIMTITPNPVPGPPLPTSLQASLGPHDITQAQGIIQLGTAVTKITDAVELLLAKMERIEAKSQVVTDDDCVPETLMAIANGLVAHNKRLKAQLEETEKRLTESQNVQTSLLTMNSQLLEEKRKMLEKETELRKEIHDMEENLKNKVTEQNSIQEKKEEKESSNIMESKSGLMPKEVQSLVKATLNGLFRHTASDFAEENSYSQSEILQALRSRLEEAYSSFLENLETITEEEPEEEREQPEAKIEKQRRQNDTERIRRDNLREASQ